MNPRELKSRLESDLDELYETVRTVTDEQTAIDIGKSIKYHQIAYMKLTKRYYLPKLRGLNDR